MMVAGAVHVAMRELLGRGISDLGNLHGEIEVLPRERMVSVHGHHVALHGGDGYHAHLPALELRLELHPGLDVADRAE